MSSTAPPAESLLQSGVYLFQQGDRVIPLVDHNLAGETVTMHVLRSREAAADLVRAFGGDSTFLNTIPDGDAHPDSA